MRLSKFLEIGEYAGACSALSIGWPGIALLPGSAQYENLTRIMLFISGFIIEEVIKISENVSKILPKNIVFAQRKSVKMSLKTYQKTKNSVNYCK